MVANFPPIPESLKIVQPYMKTAAEHDDRDPIISYWCRFFALETGIKVDKTSNEAVLFLSKLMDFLEVTKKSLTGNECVTNNIAAQAYIENYALKLFRWADNMDRCSTYNKNVVKSFYTSGLLMDILTCFGDLTEEITNNRKYAKWKAAYIHNCLKNGEIPVPGPQESRNNSLEDHAISNTSKDIPITSFTNPLVPSTDSVVQDGGFKPFQPSNPSEMETSTSTKLDPEVILKAQKYCKFAGSALNYDDVPEAISNLQKALQLLQTGQND